jgi:hypothetical protein
MSTKPEMIAIIDNIITANLNSILCRISDKYNIELHNLYNCINENQSICDETVLKEVPPPAEINQRKKNNKEETKRKKEAEKEEAKRIKEAEKEEAKRKKEADKEEAKRIKEAEKKEAKRKKDLESETAKHKEVISDLFANLTLEHSIEHVETSTANANDSMQTIISSLEVLSMSRTSSEEIFDSDASTEIMTDSDSSECVAVEKKKKAPKVKKAQKEKV